MDFIWLLIQIYCNKKLFYETMEDMSTDWIFDSENTVNL